MKESTKKILDVFLSENTKFNLLKDDLVSAFETLIKTFSSNKKLLLCGNGGSAADCEHIAGELLKSFKKDRPILESEKKALEELGAPELSDALEGGLKAISLTSHIAFSTAFANDKIPSAVFAQQLYSLGDCGDTLICISTSGNSLNCVYATKVAKIKGINVISFTGKNQSKLSELSDVTIKVPETETFKIQEMHVSVYHLLCAMIEEEMF